MRNPISDFDYAHFIEKEAQSSIIQAEEDLNRIIKKLNKCVARAKRIQKNSDPNSRFGEALNEYEEVHTLVEVLKGLNIPMAEEGSAS